MAAFEEAVELGGRRDPLSLNHLGLLLSRRGQHERACSVMHEATAVAIDDQISHAVENNAATVFHAAGRLDAAAAAYRSAWAARPETTTYGYNYANVLIEMGDYTEAISTLSMVCSQSPTFTEARWKLAVALMEAGDAKAAVEHFQRAVRISDSAQKVTKAELLYQLHDAQLSLALPDYVGAVASLEGAVREDPANARYTFALLHMYRYTATFSLSRERVERSASKMLQAELGSPSSQRPSLTPMRALPYLTPGPLRQLMSRWGEDCFRRTSMVKLDMPKRFRGKKEKMLRVALVSADWGTSHPMMHLLDSVVITASSARYSARRSH